MRKKANPTSSAGGVQVFELTMDNSEDQEELNRRLRKPGEPEPGPSPRVENTTQRESTTASTDDTKGNRKGISR